MSDRALRASLIELANEVPEMRGLVVPVLRRHAMEFSSPEALENYLKEHPHADKSRHTVVEHSSEGKGESGGKSEEGGGSGVKGKLKALIDKVKPKGSILSALKKAPEAVHKFVADGEYRGAALKKMAEGAKKSPKALGKKIAQAAKKELHEIQHATHAAKKLFKKPPGPFSKEDKKALYAAGAYVAHTVMAAIPPGGAIMAAGALGNSFAAHIGLKTVSSLLDTGFVHYEWAASLFHGVGHILEHSASAKVAEDDDTGGDDDKLTEAFMEALVRVVTEKMEKGLSEEDMEKILKGEELPDEGDDESDED